MLAANDRYAVYYAEAFDHCGVPYANIEKLDEDSLREHDVLVFAGQGEIAEDMAKALAQWVAKGGSAIFTGSAWGLASLIGVRPQSVHLSTGMIMGLGDSRLWPEHCHPVRFFGAERHAKAEAETYADLEGGVGICKRVVGKGGVWFVAPHIGQSIALMMLGRSVETDGIGPADGTVRLDDGILRAEDGTNLSFDLDRSTIEGCPTPFFSRAHADALREMLIRTTVDAMEATGKLFWMTWHWPDDAPAIAMLTIDCPKADVDQFAVSSKMLANVGGRPAWLVGHPGFPIEAYRAMHNSLQEVGVLYEGEGDVGWSPERVRMHHVATSRGSAFKRVDAIRCVDGRWEGYLHPYEIAERANSRLSIAKGGRQKGDAGFLFGSCHPIQPRRRNGEPILTYELPYTMFVPTFPEPAAEAILAETILRGGCFHIAADLQSLADHRLEASLKRLILLARQAHLKFLLPSEVAHHLDQRRSLRIHPIREAEVPGLTLTSPQEMRRLTVLLGNAGDVWLESNGNRAKSMMAKRYGAAMWSTTLNLEGKRTSTLVLHEEADSRAA